MLARTTQTLSLQTAKRFTGSYKNVNVKNPSAANLPFEGHVADSKPISVKLEAEKLYAFCGCGLSNKQPFCDGSHKGMGRTLRRPVRFTVNKTDDYWLCMCKESKKFPLCDGTHKTTSSAQDKPTISAMFGASPVYDGVARQLGYRYKNGGFQ
uniref:Iron-binding zinc finger CDGSH type domain-containing protein n=1 Tax=Panagrolaimus sp. JU765 TaxID=591449 RepID=A0AC34Q618_9BILA